MGTLTAAALLRRSLLRGARKPCSRGLGARDPRRGDGYEFAELRVYMAGDDPRHIDWAATARSDDLQTRVFFEEHGLMLAACVDGSPSMRVGRTRALYDAAREAACLWFAAAIDQDRCVRVGDERILDARRLRGRAAGSFCASHLEDAAHPDQALRLALAALPRGTALLVISDFHDFTAMAEHLRACASRFDVTALVARDPWYEGLPLGGFITLRDAESKRQARVYIGARERERYIQAAREREEALLSRLATYGMRAGTLGVEQIERDLLAAVGHT